MKMKLKFNKNTRRFLIFASIVYLIFSLSACGKKENIVLTYITPQEYVGVWYSSPGDDRGFIFHENGQFELYYVKPGEIPSVTQTGMYGVEIINDDSIINLSDSATNYKDFPISGQIWKIESGDGFMYEDVYFGRLDETGETDLFMSLIKEERPLEEFLGKWEYDTIFGVKLELGDGKYILESPDVFSTGDFIRGYDHLLINNGEIKVRVNGDGSLSLTGYEGFFYPAGSGKTPVSPYIPYVGEWENIILQEQLVIDESGGFSASKILDDGGINFSAGLLILDGDLVTIGDYTGKLQNGELVFQGVKGNFVKE